MEKIINQPIAGTFGWLYVGGTKVTLPEHTRQQEIQLTEGESKTLLLEDDGAFLSFEAKLAKEAKLHLVLLRKKDAAERCFTDVRVRLEEDAEFTWHRLILGGKETYDNVSVELAGKGSRFAADLGYDLKGEEKADVNCEAIHLGKKSESKIRSFGVLAKKAEKLLRGTIDFRRGCAGAIGNETEDVLLLDDTVHNQSVPMILCTEEDVIGNHGATIGRPEERLLYYMASRGIDEAQALVLLSRAKLEAVLHQIPDEDIQQTIKEAQGWT
ncbi:MAG: SufD family Fe-S cluster assembly protein [Acetatifactor sp.]|nr:SufD family Fe-S cluster assembly protein [Acetatifactor sp.]